MRIKPPGMRTNKKPTNLSLDPELVAAGQKFFRTTRYRSLSGFLQASLRQGLKQNRGRMEKAGVKVPASIL